MAFVLSIFFVAVPHASAACVSTNQTYCLLAPLPGLGDSVDTTQGVGSYINVLIKITIGLISVLAVVMLVVGGIEYMVSNIAGEKASAKSRMTNAIFGLILMLSSYLILNTINPKLVNLSVGIAPTTLKNFDNTKAGQDGLGVGEDALGGAIGNKVKNSSGDEITAGDQSKMSNALFLSNVDNFTSCTEHTTSSTLVIASAVKDSLYTALNKWCNDKAAIHASDPTNPDGNYKISSFVGFYSTLAPGNNSLQSSHAFGLAFDILPAATGTLPATLVSDFKSAGWGWGGDLSIKDYKHFSKLQEEQGSGNDSYHRE